MKYSVAAALALALTSPLVSAQVSLGPSKEISDFITYPRDTRAADMDGDGDLDVLSREDGGTRVLWWENDGTGKFGNRHEWAWGGFDDYAFSFADYNGDGRLDVWIETQWNQMGRRIREYRVAISAADGTFGTPVLVADLEPVAFDDDDALVADVNGDGKADLVTAEGLRIQKGDGTFAAPPQGTFAPGSQLWELDFGAYRPAELALYDFDGDGDLDLLFQDWSSYGHRLKLAANLGAGLLGSPTVILQLPEEERLVAFQLLPPADGEMGSRLLAIIEEDEGGRMEVFNLSPSGGLSPVLSEPYPLGFFGLPTALWDSTRERLIVIRNDGSDTRFLSRFALEVKSLVLPGGSSPPGWSSLLLADGVVVAPSLADLDGDGTPDLLLPFCSVEGMTGPFAGEIKWVGGAASGAFPAEPESISQLAVAGRIGHVGDFDADGDCDILTVDQGAHDLRGGYYDPYPHKLVLWKNPGNGESFERQVLAGSTFATELITVEDRDQDGDPDLLIQTFDIPPGSTEIRGRLKISWLTRAADGSYSWLTILEQEAQGLLLGAKLVNLDGDQIRDLAGSLQQGTTYAGYAARGRADGSFGGFSPRSPSRDTPQGGWDDLDHDGDPDFHWLLEYWGSNFSFWIENTGSGPAVEVELLPHPIKSLNRDIDGDGFNDFASARANDENTYYLSRPDAALEQVPASTWHTSLMDLDGDGDLDLLYPQNDSAASIYCSLHWAENVDGRSFVAAGQVAGPRFGYSFDTAMGDLDGDGTKDLIVLTTYSHRRLEWFKVTKANTIPAFGQWMTEKGLEGNRAGPLSDADGDGAKNWEEFVFGSDPKAADLGHVGRPRLERKGEDTWTYSFQRLRALTSTPRVQTSTDLKTWEYTTVPSQTQPVAAGYERVTREWSGPGPLFFRTVVPSLPVVPDP